METPRVLTLFVRAGLSAYADAESALAELFARQMPDITRDVLVIDNLLPPGIAEASPGRTVIGGDNSVWEFSALDAGLAHIGGSIRHYHVVNVVTSAFMQLYVAYLERFTSEVVAALSRARACVGHIDCYNEAVSIGPYLSQHWVRTAFFMAPVSELLALKSVVSARHRRHWFSGRVEDPFADQSPIDDTYRRYLIDWLLGEDIGQGVTWHRALTLDADGLESFEQKALAIINEHLLSIRLRAAGCPLVDVTWLSGILQIGRSVRWDTPWWQQLAERDRDAIDIQNSLRVRSLTSSQLTIDSFGASLDSQ
jgi:hypothetical protein